MSDQDDKVVEQDETDTEDYVPAILDQLVAELASHITPESAIRFVEDNGYAYQIFEVVETDSETCWYVALTENGALIGIGINYYWVVKMADAWLEACLHGLDSDDNDSDDEKLVSQTTNEDDDDDSPFDNMPFYNPNNKKTIN